jgi:hypothetical protein
MDNLFSVYDVLTGDIEGKEDVEYQEIEDNKDQQEEERNLKLSEVKDT